MHNKDIIINIANFLNYKDLVNFTNCFNNISSNLIIKKKEKAANTIKNFFYYIKCKYKDLRLNRKGYLINYNKLFKYPDKYLGKKIQFISKFQYHPFNLRSGEIGEGTLYYNSSTDSWFFNLDNNFYNYQPDEPLPTCHLLFKAFVYKKSFRILKE